MFNLQGMVFALRRGNKKNAVVCESLENYTPFPCSTT